MNWKYMSALIAMLVISGCRKERIESYRMENAAVCFEAVSSSYSLRGVTESTAVFGINVRLIGPVSDEDRYFGVRVISSDANTAVEGRDFRLLGGVVKAGELSGTVEVEVNMLKDGEPMLSTTLEIIPGENFRAGYPSYMKSVISWSDGYVRPAYHVWKAWYTYFCHGYSRNLHELIISQLGEEVEHYVDRRTPTEADSTLEFKMPTWWYSASRQLRDYVQKYDKEHPDAPLMHSSDYEYYGSYELGVGSGTRPEVLPTILSTLVIL